MQELLEGIHHWTAFRDTIGMRVHSYYVEPAAALIDPMEPDEGLAAFTRLGRRPEVILLTNRHHFRHSGRFREAFGCEVRASEPGRADLEGRDVRTFAYGAEVAPGITALDVGAISPDETALHIAHGGGAIAVADGVVRFEGELGFVSDELMGDDPEGVKRGLRKAYGDLVRRIDFAGLLMAHGEPIAPGGREALQRFVDLPGS